MCTIGAVRLPDGSVVLFKNKDFSRPTFTDRVELSHDWFGPLGLETFDDASPDGEVWSGLSIGANRHGLLACVNHVLADGVDGTNYDCLVEQAVRNCSSVEEAIAALEQRLATTPSWWGNLILADKTDIAAVEVRGSDAVVERSTDRVYRTNHQPAFGEVQSPDGHACSADREIFAAERIGSVESVEDLQAMLSSHDNSDTGICNHTALTTVYSYILHLDAEQLTFHVTSGPPCRNEWQSLPVPLGSAWSADAAERFLRRYPVPA